MKQWLVRRGLLATLPLAAIAALAVNACSSEPDSPRDGSGGPSTPATAQADAAQTTPEREIVATAAARERLARVAQFTRIVKLPKQAKPAPPGKLVQPQQADLVSEAQPVVSPGEAERFLQQGTRIRAQVAEGLKRGAIRPATVDFPQSSEGFVRIQADDAKAGIEFAAKGAKAGIAFETADGLVNYPGAAVGGGDIVLRVGREAVEDFVVLNEKPEHAFVDYTVKVSEIAGLRLYGNTLEFLAEDGDPQIRVRPPEVIDANGKAHHAKLELPDCSADDSALVPWDRPVTPPGAPQCTVRVSWDDTHVVYPAIVDPVWATAGALATARFRIAAVKQASNSFVLTCGGLDSNGDPLKSCEVFNPGANAGAGSWAAGPALKTARAKFTMLAVGNDVLAIGDTTSATSELLNVGTGIWTATATDFSTGNFSLNTLQPVLTGDGLYVVMVDQYGKPYRYSVAGKAWAAGTSNTVYRYGFATLAIPGQTGVIRCGGSGNTGTALKTCEKYTPGTDVWVMPGAAGAVVDMNAARSYAGWTGIDATHVMLYGGYHVGTGLYHTSAEIYNSSANSWTSNTPTIPNSVYESELHNSWAPHSGSGKIMTVASYYPTLYDPATTAWTQPSTYDGSTNFYTMGSDGAVVAAGSKVLVFPVSSNGASGPQTTCKLFDLVAKGGSCQQTADCKSGLTCWNDDKTYTQDGLSVCCDTTCTDPCYSCRAQNKQSGLGEGTCGPRATTAYIGYSNDRCPSESQTSCGNTGGYCDGKGACAKWDTSTSCVSSACADTDTQNNQRNCDGKGNCAALTTSECTAGYQCLGDSSYGNCVNYCYGDSYCAASYYCQTWAPPNPTANLCLLKKGSGVTCSYNSECGTGFCADGVCCDAACNGTCEACTTVLTGKTTGLCKPVTLASGKQPDCYDNGAATCGQTGYCSGTSSACQLYASGTQCQDIASCQSETVRYIPDTCNGSGSCTDKGTQACTAGYSCQAGVCNTQCTSDANCASAHYCDIPNKACVPDKVPGQSCLRDQACQGNVNCVEIDSVSKQGVCCSSACAGDCQSCLAVNTGVSDGTCSNVLDDLDPKNKCTTGAAYPNSCSAPGLCNGQGTCRAYAKNGVGCDDDECNDSTLTTYECNGAGTCKAKSAPCYPFKCDTANSVCRVACLDASQCVGDLQCKNGACIGKLEAGSACTSGAACKSTFCANIGEGVLQGQDTGAGGDGAGGAAGDPGADSPGVCCDTGCQGTCSGCKASVKGFGSDGVCEFVKNNTDPATDCEKSATDACGLDGQCNGSGACRLAPSGTSCGASSCQGNSVLGQSCNGQGDCTNNQGGIDCAPYVCRDVMDAFQCTNPCADDNDCQDGYFCSEAKCSKKLANGKACDSNGICGSGYCVDSVCCDAACNGQCEACAAPGSEGTCTPVQGEPQGTRPKCDHAGEECGGQCDGVNAATCKYKPNGDSCGTPTCDNDLASSSVCNGQGECKANKNTECSPYTCGTDDTCLARCEQDADCTQGYACDETTQRCLPSASAAACSEDRLVSQGQNGANTPCKPFLCVPASGTCAVSCAFTTDCSPDFVCEPSTKTCLPAPADTGGSDDSSCACRAAGAAPERSSYLALAALGVALTGLRRRKRSRKPATTLDKPRSFASLPNRPSK